MVGTGMGAVTTAGVNCSVGTNISSIFHGTDSNNTHRATVTPTALIYPIDPTASAATPSTSSAYAVLTLGGNVTGVGQGAAKPYEDSASVCALVVWVVAMVCLLM